MKRLFLVINNRMYCEYYKLYKIIAEYVKDNIHDKKTQDLIKITNIFPVYKDLEPYKQYKKLTRKTQFVVDDALNFIQSYQGDRFDLIYYDSLSISFETPQQSMTHHLELYEKSKHLLNREGFLVFDDTPLSLDFAMSNTDKQLLMEFEKKYGFLPGKGALVLLKADAINMKKVFHAYALILTQS